MSVIEHFVLLARYNADMNRKLYDAAAQLPAGELMADRKGFFGSLGGTLNHLLAGDTIWLKRFSTHPADFPALRATRALAQPSGLTHRFSEELPQLRAYREQLDGIISDFAPQLTAPALAQAFEYRSTRGDVYRKQFSLLLLHFFNHQTHHRGQASTLLTQAGVDIGVTDLLLWVPDIPIT